MGFLVEFCIGHLHFSVVMPRYPCHLSSEVSVIDNLTIIHYRTHLGVSWAGFLFPLLSVIPPDRAVTQVNTFLKPTLKGGDRKAYRIGLMQELL